MIAITKKPRSVVVCGQHVKVRYRKNLKDFGQFFGEDNEILIANDDKWREHLLHELLHAILFYSGHAFKFKDENDEEAFVRAMENGLKTLNFSF